MAAANNQNNGYGSGDFVNGWTSSDFVLFPRSASEIPDEHDFDADITALEKEYGPTDSGYFSSDNFDTGADENVEENKKDVPFVWCQHGHQEYTYSTNAAASTTANHGSTYNGVDNQNTATIESAGSHRREKAKKVTIHNHGGRSPRSYSRSNDKITNPSRLESWLESRERHEVIAYRLEQPAKRRRTSSSRHH
jgi:hypothetical protein